MASVDRSGDGYDDLVVSAPASIFGGGQFIEVYRGGPDGLDPYPEEHFAPLSGPDSLLYGDGLATGDFNGDGAGDVAIGAPFQTIGEEEEGVVGVWNGTPEPTGPDSLNQDGIGEHLALTNEGDPRRLGCTTVPAGASAWLVLAGLAALRRRR